MMTVAGIAPVMMRLAMMGAFVMSARLVLVLAFAGLQAAGGRQQQGEGAQGNDAFHVACLLLLIRGQDTAGMLNGS